TSAPRAGGRTANGWTCKPRSILYANAGSGFFFSVRTTAVFHLAFGDRGKQRAVGLVDGVFLRRDRGQENGGWRQSPRRFRGCGDTGTGTLHRPNGRGGPGWKRPERVSCFHLRL